MSPDDFFSSRGIYPGQVAADGLEKPCSAEILFADGEEEAVQIDSTVQIVGGSSVGRWKINKLSMRLKFDSRLNYPFFGEQGADSFATLVVDARHNNTWAYQGGSEPVNQRARAQYLRDQFSADLQRELGGAAPRGRYVNLFIDGVYWGMYNLHERPDDNFAASYFGGDNSEYDCLKHNQSTVIAGTRDGYAAMLEAARADMSKLENYEAAAELIDIDDLIKYMLVNFVLGNTDWAHQNWYATAKRANNKWRYHSWDAEKGMQRLNDNLTTKDDAGGPTGVHQDLARSPEYRMRFADLTEKILKNDGILTTEGLRRVYKRRTDEIDRGVILESARWGDTATGVTVPYTRNDHWVPQRDFLMDDYFAERPGVVLNQLKDLLAPLDAPTFSQDGGTIPAGFELSLSKSLFAQGKIVYTLDGTDPRLAGGNLNPEAFEVDGPVTLSASTVVKARIFKSSLFGAHDWSALAEAPFLVDAVPADGDRLPAYSLARHMPGGHHGHPLTPQIHQARRAHEAGDVRVSSSHAGVFVGAERSEEPIDSLDEALFVQGRDVHALDQDLAVGDDPPCVSVATILGVDAAGTVEHDVGVRRVEPGAVRRELSLALVVVLGVGEDHIVGHALVEQRGAAHLVLLVPKGEVGVQDCGNFCE
ncbi:MAG: CotH kinase family protein, partial [Verrucomicrobiota bacterium]